MQVANGSIAMRPHSITRPSEERLKRLIATCEKSDSRLEEQIINSLLEHRKPATVEMLDESWGAASTVLPPRRSVEPPLAPLLQTPLPPRASSTKLARSQLVEAVALKYRTLRSTTSQHQPKRALIDHECLCDESLGPGDASPQSVMAPTLLLYARPDGPPPKNKLSHRVLQLRFEWAMRAKRPPQCEQLLWLRSQESAILHSG